MSTSGFMTPIFNFANISNMYCVGLYAIELGLAENLVVAFEISLLTGIQPELRVLPVL